jgi:hypothetical protein
MLPVLLLACNHDITPPEFSDRDPDGSVDLAGLDGAPDPVWREGGATYDLSFPATCTTTPPKNPGSGDCSNLDKWSCIDKCGDFDRLACFNGSTVERELRCNSFGDCQCKIGKKAPVICLGMLNNGRTGCTRPREVFNQGCCKP